MRMQTLVLGAVAMVTMASTAIAADDGAALLQAVRQGDRAAVQTLVRSRADVNHTEVDGTTVLHWAVQRTDAVIVDTLVRAGARVNVANRYGVTPLSLAAVRGDARIVDVLLKAGADPRAATREGEVPLLLAARTGSVDVIKSLVASGADPNARESWMGETPLIWAAADNNASAVRALIELGAVVDARSLPVTYPAQHPKDPSNYVSSAPPKGEWTALMYAAREGADSAAAALLDAGADVNAQDPEGMTPLIEAIINMHFDLAATLLERGANPNIVDESGMSPLYAAVDMRTPSWERSRPRPEEEDTLDCVGLMKVLLDHGADPNAVLKTRTLQRYHANGLTAMTEGSTPLMRAAYYDNLDMVRLLVERGADVRMAQKDGTTAVMLASGVKYAITQEGDPEKAGTADDAYEIVKLLVERGADVNAVNTQGQTAIYGAAFVGRDRTIAYLAEQGARVDIKTRQGLSLYDAVLNKGVPEEGTGSRVGGRPGPRTVALVVDLMTKAGVPPAESANVPRLFGPRAPSAPADQPVPASPR
jgi:ankyrin repeat protein